MEWSHKIYKAYSNKFIYRLARTGVTPNEITIFNFFFTLIYGCYFFSRGTYAGNLAGLVVCFINVVLDYVDGDLAKKTNRVSDLGVWLDKGGDIVLQISIMAAIACGLWQGLARPSSSLPAVIMLYFVSKNASNAVAFQYNNVFGFDSYNGSRLFRKYMDTKPTILNRIFKNIIDPTASAAGLFIFTIRYWLIIGAVFNCMLFVFYFVTVALTIQWIVMYILFALHLREYKQLWVLQALAILDEQRKEYYQCRALMM